MKRRKIFNNLSDISVIVEDGKYVVVKKNPDVEVVVRTAQEDQDYLLAHDTLKTWFADHDMVYRVFNLKEKNGGKLILYTENQSPYRPGICLSDHADIAALARKTYHTKYSIYGTMYNVSSSDMSSGYVLLLNHEISNLIIEDDFGDLYTYETTKSKLAFHIIDPNVYDACYNISDICKHYKWNEDSTMKVRMTNMHDDLDAVITGFTWKLLPGCMYT